jgi:hypothetical protein
LSESTNGSTPTVEGPTEEELAIHNRFHNLLALERAVRNLLASQDEVERLLAVLESGRARSL